jgi:hypothetical protein
MQRRGTAASIGTAISLLLIAAPGTANQPPPAKGVQPALADPIQFNPALGRTYVLEVQSQQRLRNGQTVLFTTRHNLRFSKLGDGLAVDAVLTDVHCDGPQAFAKLFAQSLLPARGFVMRAQIPVTGGPLIPVHVPEADAISVLAELGAAELSNAFLPQASAEQSAASIPHSQSMWLDDIASVMRFANVDLDKLAQSRAADWQIERKSPNQWIVRNTPAAIGAIKIASEFTLDRQSGMVLQSVTETQHMDANGPPVMMNRKHVRITAS